MKQEEAAQESKHFSKQYIVRIDINSPDFKKAILDIADAPSFASVEFKLTDNWSMLEEIIVEWEE